MKKERFKEQLAYVLWCRKNNESKNDLYALQRYLNFRNSCQKVSA